MIVRENVVLAPFTTLGVGGRTSFFVEVSSATEIAAAIAFAKKEQLPVFVLGKGSNILVPDEGVSGVVIHFTGRDVVFSRKESHLEILADAGALWDKIVQDVTTEGVFGVENLAAIPGSVAGAVVQNIGAYGSELQSVFAYAAVTDMRTGEHTYIQKTDAQFGYRTSIFKQHPEHLITQVIFHLPYAACANLAYPDLRKENEKGTPLASPQDIVQAVRAIRAQKFPQKGSAGSFFKNPILPAIQASELLQRFPGLPSFSHEEGRTKIPLAWILDRILDLKGYTKGAVRLYEKQPLVIVTSEGATAVDVEMLATDIETRVYEATGIRIEREVETFGGKLIRA
jgi:UDP-N-acetylmuramate dehydrogenase